IRRRGERAERKARAYCRAPSAAMPAAAAPTAAAAVPATMKSTAAESVLCVRGRRASKGERESGGRRESNSLEGTHGNTPLVRMSHAGLMTSAVARSVVGAEPRGRNFFLEIEPNGMTPVRSRPPPPHCEAPAQAQECG